MMQSKWPKPAGEDTVSLADLPDWVGSCHCGRTFVQCEADPCDRRAQDFDAVDREARCRGCGCYVDFEHLNAEGFGPDCWFQDEGSMCG